MEPTSSRGQESSLPTTSASEGSARATFDYDSIPKGYYDRVLHEGNAIRRLWHVSKFERVLDYLPVRANQSILDIGCFAGTFLSLCPQDRFGRQLGVDILPEQVAYANEHYGTSFRSFRHLERVGDLGKSVEERFDCITLIEVIEHLERAEVATLLDEVVERLEPGGKLVFTTPNYASAWPAIELVLNRLSDVSYAEQHITKFTYFNMERELEAIYPDLWLYFNTLDFKTTTHFITPFLAGLSYEAARRLSRVVPHQKWRHPFGSLILMVLTRGPARRR